jgi:hypothetical protein
MVAGVALVWSYQAYTSKYHIECDQEIETRDGRECVGDNVVVKGGDKVAALLLVVIAGFIFWHSAKPD